MRRSTLLYAVLLVSASAPVSAACNKPAAPTIPAEGRISARDERAIRSDMQRYSGEMTTYLACLEQESPDAAARQAAVAEQRAVTTLFTSRIGPVEGGTTPASPGAAPAAAAATAAGAPAAGVNCIPSGRGLSYNIGRDQNVVFRSGGQRYVVNLAHCPRIQRNSTLTFETGGGLGAQLCNGSTLSMEGGTCRVQNQFRPITAEDADAFLR
jgi:hypothetical protein